MDLARSYLLFGGGSLPPGIPAAWIMRIFQPWFYRIYVQRYYQLHPFDLQQLSHWIPVAVAARLDENIYFDERRLLSIAHRLV